MLKLLVTLQTLPALLLERVERNDKGATMIEYGMICGLIIAVVIAAMALLSGAIGNLFTEVNAKIDGAFTTAN